MWFNMFILQIGQGVADFNRLPNKNHTCFHICIYFEDSRVQKRIAIDV